MEVTLLSFAEILPENLFSFQRSAEKLKISLKEIKPTDLSLYIHLNQNRVLYEGQTCSPQIVLHRTVAKFESLISPILETLEHSGSLVLNNPRASKISRNKLESLLVFQRENLPFLPSQFLFEGEIHKIIFQGKIISKPIFGSQGRGIKFFANNEIAEESISTSAKDINERDVEPVLLQEDLGEYVKDYRAHVVGGKCVALMNRIPPIGKRLANIAQGGSATPLELSHPAARLAEKAVIALGLDYAGVDLLSIGEDIYLSEIDAWAGFVGIEKVTGVSVSEAILTLAMSKL